VDGLLERVGIEEYAADRADSIPTGTARLLELARALACGPKLLMLDEPSSGLDESETDDLGRLIRELAAEGRAVLLVEHDMDLVMKVCDEIHVLDFGAVISSGTPAAVRADERVQKAYLGDDEGDAPGGGAAGDTSVLEPVTAEVPVVRR
jgi:branched-chain amino acid transport system ATP-binding protein